jgi:glucose/arabinose dehydrogenase
MLFTRKVRAVRVAVVAALLTMLMVPASLTSIASAVPTLPSGFVLRDQPSGQAAFDLTDFAYLPDGTLLSIGKKDKVAWVGPDGNSHVVATLPVNNSGDLGLVGLAVAPDYATSRQIYLTRSVPTHEWRVRDPRGPLDGRRHR